LKAATAAGLSTDCRLFGCKYFKVSKWSHDGKGVFLIVCTGLEGPDKLNRKLGRV